MTALLTMTVVLTGSAAPAVHRAAAPRAALVGLRTEHIGQPDMYVDFSVSGADITPVLGEDGKPTSSYTGQITGSKLAVTGKFHFQMGKGLKTYLSFGASISAGDAHGEHRYPKEGGAKTLSGGDSGVTVSESFNVSVDVPKVAPTGSISISLRNCGDWVCGGLPEISISLTGPRPICPEATGMTGLFDVKDGGASRLRWDQATLAADLQKALENQKVTVSASKIPPLDTAWYWLFPNGFPSDPTSISRWSFTDPDRIDVNKVRDIPASTDSGGLYNATTQLPAGAGEARLAQAIAATSTSTGTRLTPGQVLSLALAQTDGDARRAALLAHNTLKALGRGGGDHILGVKQDPSFFDRYVAEIQHDPNPANAADNTARNAGEWYHLFGTMHFRLEAADGINWWSDAVVRGGSSLATYFGVAAGAASAKLTVPLILLGGGTGMVSPEAKRLREMLINLAGKGLLPGGLGYSEYANWGEQLYRELLNTGGKQAPDPEKYCVNVWGVQLADLLWKLANPTLPFELFDDTKTNPYSTMAGDTVSLDQQPHRDYTPADLQVIGIHSPVDAMIEVNGETLVLDQRHGVLVGNPSRPVTVAPEGNGTYMLGLTALASEPVRMTLRGSATGVAHVLRLDTRTGTMTTWESKVKAGTKLVLDLSQPDPAADVTRALTDADGKAITARQVNLLTETGPTTRRLLIALFVALVLGAVAVGLSFLPGIGAVARPVLGGGVTNAVAAAVVVLGVAATSGVTWSLLRNGSEPGSGETTVASSRNSAVPAETGGPATTGSETSTPPEAPTSSEDSAGAEAEDSAGASTGASAGASEKPAAPAAESSRQCRSGRYGWKITYPEGWYAADDTFPEWECAAFDTQPVVLDENSEVMTPIIVFRSEDDLDKTLTEYRSGVYDLVTDRRVGTAENPRHRLEVVTTADHPLGAGIHETVYLLPATSGRTVVIIGKSGTGQPDTVAPVMDAIAENIALP
jgi:hypothetical protein